MRKHLLTTLLTLTLIGGLIGCGKSETAKVTETPVVEEETVTTTEVSENTDEVEEVTEKPETEEVRKPNASAHYKEWRNKQKEAEATEEVAEVTETEEKTVDTKKEDKKATETKTETPAATTTTNNNTTSAASNNTNNNTNNNSTPAPQPTKTETAASTPAKTEAPSPATCNHTFTTTSMGGEGHDVQVGTGQYEQVIVDMKPGDPIYDEYGDVVGWGPETPVYETREVTVWKTQRTRYYQDTCTKCGYTTTRSETVIE